MKLKMLFLALTSLAFNSVMGATVGHTVGFDPMAGAIGANVIAAVCSNMLPSGVARAGVFREVWTGELVKHLRGKMEATWLDGLPDSSSLVNNDVIHLIDVGVDPEVLINNTTYPILPETLTDEDIPIGLDKFQTRPTSVTDDELHALSYDKMTRVKESHGNSIHDSKFTKAAHALCATENTSKTPVLVTTGERDAATGRLKMTLNDVINMKRAMDNLGVPAQNRRLVLCSDHVNDLLESNQSFREQYNINRNEGTVGRLYGFDIYEFGNTPLYTTGGVKKAVGATASAGEFHCSFAFYTPRVFKATGSMKMYYSDAANDPQYQRNLISFRHYFICMPKKVDAGVVMCSGYQATTLNAPSPAAVPTISGAGSLNVDASAGSNERTYATSNGAGVTAETDADWLTVSVDGNKVTFTRQAYAYSAEGSETRSATVTIGISGTDVTKTVTVTQAMAENV